MLPCKGKVDFGPAAHTNSVDVPHSWQEHAPPHWMYISFRSQMPPGLHLLAPIVAEEGQHLTTTPMS